MTPEQRSFPSGGHLAVLRTPGWFTRPSLALAAVMTLGIAASARQSGAQFRQDFLTANIDTTVSPREDFFQFANGGWIRRNPIPDDRARWGFWDLVYGDLEVRLRRINEVAALGKAPKGSLEQLVGDFWFTGMDSATINRQGLAPLQPDLDRIDRVRSTRDLVDVVAKFHREFSSVPWRRVLFAGITEQQEQNTDRWIYSLLQSGISMGPGAYAGTGPQQVRMRAGFHEYAFKTFFRLQRDSATARQSADRVFALEAQLAKASGQPSGDQTIGLAELTQLAPTFDWPRYFRGIGIARIDSVIMRNPAFYHALDSLLSATSLETWRDYLRFWLIKTNAPFLDDRAFGDLFTWQRIGSGALQPSPRWQRVQSEERNFKLGQPLARLFEKQYAGGGLKARQQALAESLRAAFRRRIESLDWMSDSTKKRALAKLAQMTITIGESGNGIDYSSMPLRRDSYVQNQIRASEWYHDRRMHMLSQPVDRRTKDPSAQFADDWYDYRNNEVVLSAAETVPFVPGSPDEVLDDAVVYGMTVLAHEISHAFDSEGRHYDARGNKADWWTAADDTAFVARAQVMVDQYREFTLPGGVHLDGRSSLPENLADLVGCRIALDAFKQTEQFRKNERIGGYTPLQRFFLAYAFRYARHERIEVLAGRRADDPYPPDRERVNGVVVNMPEFYEAFDVKPGDRMHRAENARVKVW